jgi:hypothetical protein
MKEICCRNRRRPKDAHQLRKAIGKTLIVATDEGLAILKHAYMQML